MDTKIGEILDHPKASQIINEFESHHSTNLQEASRRGEEDGKRNMPPVPQISMTPYEKIITAQYQEEIYNLGRHGNPWLKEINDNNISSIDGQLKHYSDRPDDIVRKIQTAEMEKNRLVQQAEIGLQEKIKNIENHKSWDTLKREYEEIKKRFTEYAEKVGRHELLVHVSPQIYIPLLIAVGICEIPITYKIFLSFRDTPAVTLIMAGVLVLSLPILAHFGGKFLRQVRENKLYMLLHLLTVVIIVSLSITTAMLRANYLTASGSIALNQLNTEFWTFFIINIVLYYVGMAASVAAHDPSERFTRMHQEYTKVKYKFEIVATEIADEVKSLRVDFEKLEKQYQDNYTVIKYEWDNKIITLYSQLHEAAAYYNKVLAFLQDFELKVNNCKKQTINMYRDRNLTYRDNREEPGYWREDLVPLDYIFSGIQNISI